MGDALFLLVLHFWPAFMAIVATIAGALILYVLLSVTTCDREGV